MKIKKKRVLIPFLFLFLAVLGLSGLALGSARFPLNEVIAVFTGGGDPTVRLIVLQLRLPRVAGAVLAGAGLAVSGLLLQSATGNDLCSPNIIGVNSGAGFAVMVLLCLFPMAFAVLPLREALAAFAGALFTTFLVLGISVGAGGHQSKSTVLLAGVAVSSLLSAGISFLSQLVPDALASYSAFSIGGFSGVQGADLIFPAIMIGVGTGLAWGLAPQLNLLCLGDELAATLGVRVKALRLICLILASALCAAVVTYAGLLGFVGLIVPHLARKLAGHDLRILVPVTALLGANLVVLSDLAGRTLFSPAELPAGILMALLGAPFFLFILFQRRGRYA